MGHSDISFFLWGFPIFHLMLRARNLFPSPFSATNARLTPALALAPQGGISMVGLQEMVGVREHAGIRENALATSWLLT